ncbi:hypothetical protein CLAFUR0_04583 [Fulvia fulva]|nr:hypothetical protein CLAFUR0_04583 [Fulvia fulva]
MLVTLNYHRLHHFFTQSQHQRDHQQHPHPPPQQSEAQEDMAVSEGMTSAELAARDTKAKKQLDSLRQRVTRSARAIIQGKFRSVENKYKPTGGPAREDKAWMDMVDVEDRLVERATHVETNRGDPKTAYLAIVDTRREFPELARKVPGPVRPESLRTPSPQPAPSIPPPPYPAANIMINASGVDTSQTGEKRRLPPQPAPGQSQTKKEVIDIDSDEDNDDHRDNDYDPVDDASSKREERAKKRHRSENKDNFASKIRKTEDEEDLEYQLKEIQMKADMQKLAVERKLAAIRRQKKEDAAAAATEAK